MTESHALAAERDEQNRNPDRRSHLSVAREEWAGGEPMPTRLVYGPRGSDPWFCWCGEAIDIDEPACIHGRYLCPEHVDECGECVDEKADAREDFERKYEKEQGR
ncbi:hypothetical protein [Nocardioides aurantiacus]|uniref:Uncharacterized protein n=1 Tax=Nocardioides aurantiacus TaxID=86796 RepID=A0A3N2CW04_9ACTN|nr:hypothetical protein [Nocardioides aurantiacus]ROR91727.1 hypothetical protein EDD33_2602 [Nocardioides aurantiacus]